MNIPHRPAPQFNTTFLLSLECLVAALLAFLLLAEKSFTLDETFSVELAQLDWSDQWRVLTSKEANMALYYLLLDGWLSFGSSEFLVRSLSAAFAIASVPAIYLLGRRLFGPTTGLVAGLLLTTNQFWLHYAQDARAYSLVLLLVILSSYAFIEALERRTPSRWMAYVLLSALAVYAHSFAMFVLVAQGLSFLVLARLQPVPWRQYVMACGAIGVLLLPFLAFTFTTTEGHQLWIPRLLPEHVLDVFVALAGGPTPIGKDLIPIPGLGYYLPVFAYFAACGGTVIAAATSLKRGPPEQIWRYLFLLIWLGLPVAIVVVISVSRPLLAERFFMVCLPALVLLASAGVAQLRDRRVLAGAVGALAVASLSGVYTWYADADKEDWRGASELILSQARQGDAVVFFIPQTLFAFEYYQDQSEVRHTPVPEYYAEEGAEPLDIFLVGYGGPPPDSDQRLVERLSTKYERVWLVVNRGEDIGRLEGLSEILGGMHSELSEEYRPISEVVLGRASAHRSIHVWLYEGILPEPGRPEAERRN